MTIWSMSSDRPRRRLLAILAADAAGYSRLMALDDLGTVAALEESRAVFRSLVAHQGGRVVDTAGDSVLAVFESATAAAEAALAAQGELGALAVTPIHREDYCSVSACILATSSSTRTGRSMEME